MCSSIPTWVGIVCVVSPPPRNLMIIPAVSISCLWFFMLWKEWQISFTSEMHISASFATGESFLERPGLSLSWDPIYAKILALLLGRSSGTGIQFKSRNSPATRFYLCTLKNETQNHGFQPVSYFMQYRHRSHMNFSLETK